MKKEFAVHQYVIQNMQEMCMPNYLISKFYYPSITECKKDWEFEPMFKVRHAYRKSKVSGKLAQILWRRAKREREKKREEK